MQYIASKVRQADAEDDIFVGSFDAAVPAADGDTLYLLQRLDSGDYCTRIYAEEGSIRELFAEKDAAFQRTDGEKIMDVSALSFHEENGRLTIDLTDKAGGTEQLTLALRSGKAVAE